MGSIFFVTDKKTGALQKAPVIHIAYATAQANCIRLN